MSLFRSIVFSAAVAGLVVGTAVTVVQQFGTVPLIQRAETYEHAAESRLTAGTTAVHQHAGHDHGVATWEPRAGLERSSVGWAVSLSSQWRRVSGSRPDFRAPRPRHWKHVRSGGSQRRPRRRRGSGVWCV